MYTLEDIYESIINGQRRQALEQLKESSYLLSDLFEYLIDQNSCKEIISLQRIIER